MMTMQKHGKSIQATTTTLEDADSLRDCFPPDRETATRKLALCMTEFVLQWVPMGQHRADDMYAYFCRGLEHARGFGWTRLLREYFEKYGSKHEAVTVGVDIIERMYGRDGLILSENDSRTPISVCEARKKWLAHLCGTRMAKDRRSAPQISEITVAWISYQPDKIFAPGGTWLWRNGCLLRLSYEKHYILKGYDRGTGKDVVKDELSFDEDIIIQLLLDDDRLLSVEKAAWFSQNAPFA